MTEYDAAIQALLASMRAHDAATAALGKLCREDSQLARREAGRLRLAEMVAEITAAPT
jgi:hypothetical protein